MAVTSSSRFLRRSSTTSRPPSGAPTDQIHPSGPSSAAGSFVDVRIPPPNRSPFHPFSSPSPSPGAQRDRSPLLIPQATQKSSSSGQGLEWRSFALSRTRSLSRPGKGEGGGGDSLPFLRRTSTLSRRKALEGSLEDPSGPHRRTHSAESEPRDVWEAAEQDVLRSWEAAGDSEAEPPRPGNQGKTGSADGTQFTLAPNLCSMPPRSPRLHLSPVPPRSPTCQHSPIPPRSPSLPRSPAPIYSPSAQGFPAVPCSPGVLGSSGFQGSSGSGSISRQHATLVRVESLQERLSRSASTS